MKRKLLAGIILLAAGAWAQEKSLYRLQFTLNETENGKAVNTRTYSMQVVPQNYSRINAGSRVPIPSGTAAGSPFTYVDVGVSVRARVVENGALLQMDAEVEVSSIGADRTPTAAPAPRIEQLRASVNSALQPGQPASIAVLDDPAGTRHYEIQVTATKLK